MRSSLDEHRDVIYAGSWVATLVAVTVLVYWLLRTLASRTEDCEETLPPEHGRNGQVPGGE